MIPPEELKIERIYFATGTTERPGGQYAGSPASDIRITHTPTGIMAQCGCFRSEHKNKLVATEMLEAALTSRWAKDFS